MKIYVKAYFNNNLGDDLFVKMLCRHYPKVKFFTVAYSDRTNSLHEIKNIKVIELKGPLKYLQRASEKLFKRQLIDEIYAKRCNATVFIGGSIFMQKGTNWRKKLLIQSNYKMKDQPFFILSANFGPFKDIQFKNAYEKWFASLTDICFRDKYSCNLFSSLNNVRYAPDVVFTYKFNKNLKKDKSISIACINPDIKKDLFDENNGYFESTLHMVNEYLSRGYTINLLALCRSQGDTLLAENIKRLSDRKENVFISEYNGCNSDEVIGIITKSEYVISARFHGIIISLAAGIPVFPIIYSDKTKNMLEDVSFIGNCCSIGELNNKTFDFIDFNRTLKEQIDKNLIEKSANGQFNILDKFINNDL